MGCSWKHVRGVCIVYGIPMLPMGGYPYRKAQPFLPHPLPFLEVTLSYLSSISCGQQHSDSSFFIFEDCTTSSLLERTVKKTSGEANRRPLLDTHDSLGQNASHPWTKTILCIRGE